MLGRTLAHLLDDLNGRLDDIFLNFGTSWPRAIDSHILLLVLLSKSLFSWYQLKARDRFHQSSFHRVLFFTERKVDLRIWDIWRTVWYWLGFFWGLNLNVFFFTLFQVLRGVERGVELHNHGKLRVIFSHFIYWILSGFVNFKNHFDDSKFVDWRVSASLSLVIYRLFGWQAPTVVL